jgi:hypothetical protein
MTARLLQREWLAVVSHVDDPTLWARADPPLGPTPLGYRTKPRGIVLGASHGASRRNPGKPDFAPLLPVRRQSGSE